MEILTNNSRDLYVIEHFERVLKLKLNKIVYFFRFFSISSFHFFFRVCRIVDVSIELLVSQCHYADSTVFKTEKETMIKKKLWMRKCQVEETNSIDSQVSLGQIKFCNKRYYRRYCHQTNRTAMKVDKTLIEISIMWKHLLPIDCI